MTVELSHEINDGHYDNNTVKSATLTQYTTLK